MIRSIIFQMMKESRQTLSSGRTNDFEDLRYILENSDDEMIFIHTNEQADAFDAMYEKYNLKEFLHYKSKNYLTNYNYPDKGRRLKLYILKGSYENQTRV